LVWILSITSVSSGEKYFKTRADIFGAKTALYVGMIVFMSLLGVALLGSFVYLMFNLINAPEGSEDTDGFHYTEAPASSGKNPSLSSTAVMHRV
jgi:hypothetical protein